MSSLKKENYPQLAQLWEDERIGDFLEQKMRFFNVRRYDEVEFKDYLRKESYIIERYEPYQIGHVLDRFYYTLPISNKSNSNTKRQINCEHGVGVYVNMDRWKENFYKELERRERYLDEKSLVTNIIQEIGENYIKKDDLFICPICDNTCEKNFKVCPYCEYKFPTCEICKGIIRPDQPKEICFVCDNDFHKSHIQEHIKVSGKNCPICKEVFVSRQPQESAEIDG